MLDNNYILDESSLQSLQSEVTPLHLREKLSFIHILGIAASKLAPSIIFMVLPTFFQPLSQKLNVPDVWKTILLFISSFAGFVVSPLVGVYSDCSMCKWGRRRIYIVVSLIFMLIGLLMMSYCQEIGQFIKPNSQTLKQIIFGFSYEFVVISGNMIDTPARAICTDVTPISQQNLISNVCSVYAGLGGIIVSVIGGLGLEKYLKNIVSLEQFILIVSTIICTISIIITVLVAHEEPLNIKLPRVRPFKQIFDAFRLMPKPIIRTIPSFLLIAITYFQFAIQFTHFIAFDIFHGDNSPGSSEEKENLYEKGIKFAMICSAVRYGAQFIYGFLCTKLSDLIGFKWTTFFGYICMTIGMFMFLFINNRYAYLGVSALVGIGFHTAVSVPFSIISICTTVLKLDFGAYYGILMMFSVTGEQISNLGIGTCLNLIWPNNPRMLIVVSSAFGLISSLLSLIIIEPPDQKHGLDDNAAGNYQEIN